MSVSIGVRVFRAIMKDKFTDNDLMDETGASRHAIALWRKELADQNLIVPCGIRKAGDKELPVWKLNRKQIDDSVLN